MKLIIDTDPGIDDAYGIAFASVCDDTEILAFTLVNGNTTIDNCIVNANLIVDILFDGKEKPPIYVGAREAILENIQPSDRFYYFGLDGLTETTGSDYKVQADLIKNAYLNEKKVLHDQHAALKIIELVNKYPNEITILALGPLTNLALAINLSNDPDTFTRNIKQLVIMGGSEPNGFSEYPASSVENYPEFNFRMDPVAAKVVLDRYKCPIVLYTFHTCLRSFYMNTADIAKEFDKFRSFSKRCEFLANIGLKHRMKLTMPEIFRSCDLLATIGLYFSTECNAVKKRLGKYSIEVNNKCHNGAFKEDQNVDETRDIELVIKMDLEGTIKLFKKYLYKLAMLDKP